MLAPYLHKHRAALTIGFLFIILQNYAVSKIPAYMRGMLDEITGANRLPVIMDNIRMAVFFTALTIVSMYGMRKLIIGVSRKIEFRLRSDIFDKFLRLDAMFFRFRETGDLVSRSTNDLNDVRTLLGPGMMYVPNSLTRVALFLPIMFSLSPRLMVWIVVLIITVVITILLLMPLLRVRFRRVQEASAAIQARVWQEISGIETIKLHTLEQVETRRFASLNRWYIRKQMDMVRYRGFMWPFFVFVFSLAELLILVIGGRQVISGVMTIGQLLQFNILVSYLTFPILSLGWVMSLIQQGISAMGRISEILDSPEESRQEDVAIPDGALNVEVRNLSYRYPQSDDLMLKSISMDIRKGETVGITGPIGCGKSTLAELLTGILQAEPGMIFLNGMDISQISATKIGSRVTLVPQDPFLFTRTIAENIALGECSPAPEQTLAAAKKAGLEKDLASFPNGIDEMVGERGITLSGGQKQRVAIARALYRDASFLVLDDALSSVDSRTESKILQALSGEKQNRAVIIISHRITALKNTSRIYVLDEGRIMESGTHADLIQKDGLYGKLARLQQMEEEPVPQQNGGDHENL
ncbi:MAG: ABC transporter ATP-binding protein [Acidobacteria bacterium]|nr:ABC transporter ATP-binding protein [Acidobacteriota bacterium]